MYYIQPKNMFMFAEHKRMGICSAWGIAAGVTLIFAIASITHAQDARECLYSQCGTTLPDSGATQHITTVNVYYLLHHCKIALEIESNTTLFQTKTNVFVFLQHI